MKRWKVYITRMIPEEGINVLKKAGLDVSLNSEDRALTKPELLEQVADVEAFLVLLTDRIDQEVIRTGKKLKIIANYAVGYENIDVGEATRRGIMVTNTPGVLTDATADLSWALLFAAARRMVEADRFVRECRFKGWGPMLFLGAGIMGRTLGIIGAGRIGSAMALRAKGFNMKVLYVSNHKNPKLERLTRARKVSLDYLLKNSDFISIHVPLTEKTVHMIGRREFELMKETAYIVNTSRGKVIDEEALAEALFEKKIAGAGLDVFENEPEVNPKLFALDNVVIVPHIGSATIESRVKMAVMAANNIVAGYKGHSPDNLVNLKAFKR